MDARMKWCAALLGAALMVGGCGEDTDDNATPTAPPPGSTPTAPQATGETTNTIDAQAQRATDVLGDQAKAAGDAAQSGAQQAGDALKTGAQDATDAANAAANDPAVKDAQTQVQQVMQYIKENKYDLAETTLQKLEANKASLPATIQPQVDRARQMLNAAKAGAPSGAGSTGAAPSLPPAPAPAPAQ